MEKEAELRQRFIHKQISEETYIRRLEELKSEQLAELQKNTSCCISTCNRKSKLIAVLRPRRTTALLLAALVLFKALKIWSFRVRFACFLLTLVPSNSGCGRIISSGQYFLIEVMIYLLNL